MKEWQKERQRISEMKKKLTGKSDKKNRHTERKLK